MAVEDTLEVQVKTEADKATKSLDAMIDKIGGIANALNKIDVSKLSNVFDNLQKSMNGINSQISNMGNAAKTAGANMSKGMKEASKAADDVQNSMSAMTRKTSESVKKIEDGWQKLEMPEFNFSFGGFNQGEITKEIENVDSLGARLRQLKNELKDLSNQGFDLGDEEFDEVFQEFEKINNQVKNYKKNLSISAIGIDEDKAKFDSLGSTVGKLKQELTILQQQGLSFGDAGFDAVYVNLVKATNEAKNYKKALDNKATGVDEDIQKTGSLGNKVDELKKKLKDLSKQGLNFGDADFDKTYQDLNKAEKKLNKYRNRLIKVDDEQKKVSLSAPFAKLSAMASSAASRIKAFASSFASGIGGVTKMGQSVDNLTGKLAKLFIGFQTLKGIGKTLLGSIESASDYIEGYNYFDVAFTKIADESKNNFKQYGYDDAQSYADSFEQRLKTLNSKLTGFDIDKSGELSMSGGKSLGMDITQMTQYEAQIGQMTNSVGMMGEASLTSSKAMARLAGDMSSLTNMPIEQVQQNFTSALSGMAMSVKKYGIDITSATLQEYANKLGIDKKVATMTQAEKTYLREIAIVQQSKVAWGDQANTINSIGNQYRMLQAGLKNTAVLIGKLLIPAVKAVLPWLNAMVGAINDGLSAIGKMLGIKFDDSSFKAPELETSGDDSWGDMDSAVEDTTKNIEKADKAQKKFNKQLQGFDKLNNLTTTKNEKTKTPSTTGNADVSGILNDALLKSLADYEKAWNKAFDGMSNTAEKLKKKLEKMFTKAWKTGDGSQIGAALANGLNKAIDAIDKAWPKIDSGMKKVAEILATAFNSFVEKLNWGKLGKVIGNALKSVEQSITIFFEKVDWANFGKKLSEGFRAFLESGAIANFFKTVGAMFRAGVQTAFGFITDFAENGGFEKIGKQLGWGIKMLFSEMTKIDEDTGLNGFQELGKTFEKGITGLMDSIITMLDVLDPSAIGNAIADFLGSIDFAKIGSKLGELAIKIFDFLTAALNGIPWSDIGKSISDFISGIPWKDVAISLSGFARALLNSITKVISGIDWKKVGESIGTFIQNIDWGGIFKDLGKLALALITGIADAIKGFASKSPIGAAIAGLFAAPKIVTVIAKIIKLISGISSTVETVVGTIQVVFGAISAPVAVAVAAIALVVAVIVNLWKTSKTFRTTVVEAFEKVRDAVVKVFKEDIIPTVKQVISAIGDLVSSIIDAYNHSPLKAIIALIASLAAAVAGNVISTAIKLIGTAFSGIGKIVAGVIKSLSGIVDVLSGLGSLDFAKVVKGVKKIGKGIVTAFSGFGKIVIGIGADLMLGLLDGILSIAKTFGSWIKEHVFTPIVDAIKRLFGIHSPSTVFADFGKNMIDGLKQGLSGIWESIKSVFTGLWNSLKSWWEKNVKLPEIKLPSAEDVKNKIDSIKKKWDDWKAKGKELVASAKEKAGEEISKIKEKWDDWKTGTKEFYVAAKEKAGEKIDTIKKKWDDWKANVKNLVVAAKEKAGNKISDIKSKWEGWKAKAKDLVVNAKEKAHGALSKLKGVWDKFTSKTIKLDVVTDLVKAAIRKVVTWINKYIIGNLNKLQFKVAGKKIGINIPEINVPSNFATGGYPRSQELFYANENGKAELIGRQGNRATVVNNDQIIKSVSAGVSDAVFNTMNPVLTHLVASINKMNNSNTGTPLYVEGVSEGDIVRITTDANRDYKNRTGRPLYA